MFLVAGKKIALRLFYRKHDTLDELLTAEPWRFAVLRDPANWLSVNPVRGTVNTSANLDRESPYVHNNKYTAVFMATDNGTGGLEESHSHGTLVSLGREGESTTEKRKE
ncbi:hypothetical protein DPEC_G00215080 [Dallia pectoralis]|uniref:Uncharacterized protein n=1 Tax=Dallia pectoralis TaxID=75939 RepID=A0ACC2G292_DALPE|nr:hypothetical protein DPEC_G00215080 [Dallia pectoralis]